MRITSVDNSSYCLSWEAVLNSIDILSNMYTLYFYWLVSIMAGPMATSPLYTTPSDLWYSCKIFNALENQSVRAHSFVLIHLFCGRIAMFQILPTIWWSGGPASLPLESTSCCLFLRQPAPWIDHMEPNHRWPTHPCRWRERSREREKDKKDDYSERGKTSIPQHLVLWPKHIHQTLLFPTCLIVQFWWMGRSIPYDRLIDSCVFFSEGFYINSLGFSVCTSARSLVVQCSINGWKRWLMDS